MKLPRLSKLFTIALMATMLASGARAACDVRLERMDTASWNRSGGYDVFDTVGYADRFGFEVLHPDKDGEPCEVVARIEPIGGTRLAGPGRKTLGFEVRSDANQPNGAGSIEFKLDLQPGERRQLGYFIFLPSRQFVTSGSYEGRLALAVFEGVDDREVLRDNREVPLRAQVGSSAQVSFVGAVGRRQTIDFGELTDGKSSPPVFLDVQSTADYEITMTSEEGGRLIQRVDGDVWVVDYAASLNGTSVDLARGQPTAQRFQGPTDPVGRRVPVRFRLGTVGEQRAGIYRDRITIEITATSP